MDRYIFKSARSTDGKIPKLTHLEKSTFEVQLLTEDGTPFDLTGYAAECAVNNSFDHSRGELMAYASGENCAVTDAANGIIQITIDCNTVKFGQVVRFREANAMLELNLIDQHGEAKRHLLLKVQAMPRIRAQEGAPSSGDPHYLNEAEINALMTERGFLPSGGEAGAVLMKTATGLKWDNIPQPEIDRTQSIINLTGTAVTPAPDTVFRKTLADDDTFTISTTGLSADKQVTFELHLIQPSTAVTFTFPASLIWPDKEGDFDSANPPPIMTIANKRYCIVIRWDGSDLLANLAYKKTIEVSA